MDVGETAPAAGLTKSMESCAKRKGCAGSRHMSKFSDCPQPRWNPLHSASPWILPSSEQPRWFAGWGCCQHKLHQWIWFSLGANRLLFRPLHANMESLWLFSFSFYALSFWNVIRWLPTIWSIVRNAHSRIRPCLAFPHRFPSSSIFSRSQVADRPTQPNQHRVYTS